MADRVRQHPWAETPLGASGSWSAAVRAAVNNVLSSPFPACACFGEQLVMVYNDAFTPILGDKHPALGSTFERTWKEAWHIIGPIAHDALRGKSTFIENFPLQINRSAGMPERAYFTFSYSPLHDADGAVIGMLDSVFETTATVQAELRMQRHASALSDEAQRSEAARERVWQLSTEAMLVLDREMRIEAINPAFCDLLGWTTADVVGSTFLELTGHAEATALEAEVNRSRSGATVIELEIRMPCKDGRRTAVQWRGATQENITLLVGRDLTAQHDAALALQQTQAALQQSQKLESIGQLTGGIAHDFNNLLQVISGNLQMLALEVQGNDRARLRLDGARAGVERGARLASHLLAFGRKQTLDPKVVDIGLVVVSMQDMLSRPLGEAIEVELDIDREVWSALVDASQLENALLNLCINARDAMDGAGHLTITVSNVRLDSAYAALHEEVEPGEYVQVTVSDTGSGMPPDVLEKAFDPFFTTKPEGKGSGLGLSMVFGFIRQSGGHVEIVSAPDTGTTVKLYLPRSLAPVDEAVDTLLPAVIEGGSETILVVEDDLDVQETVVSLLRQLGYTVLKANDAASALAIVESGIPVDLLFADVIMPGAVRSPELARRARQAQPGIAILLTSGFVGDTDLHARRLEAGVQLLAKPYSREMLAWRIRHVLSEQSARNVPALIPGDHVRPRPPAPARHHVLFVEDNPLICEVTVELLESAGHRVTVAVSAREAMERLSDDQTVLVTDIHLPDQTGDELAKWVRSHRNDMGVIFASGSEYALPFAHAVHLKKPYGPDELERALDAAWSEVH